MSGRPAPNWARRFPAVALLLALALSACEPNASPPRGPSPSNGAERKLRVRLPYEPRSLDPALASSQVEIGVVRQLREPLLLPAAGLAGVEPAAAESWTTSADGLTYSFTLQERSRYSDGLPVRAQDFVYAWRRLLDPRLASPSADLFAAVVRGGEAAQSLDPVVDAGRLEPALDRLGLAAPDDRTFVVTLPRPAAQMPWMATLPQGAPVRRDLVEKGGDWWSRPESAAGNGPFQLHGMDLSRRLELDPNPDYRARAPSGSGLVFEIVKDDAEALARFDGGTLDIAEIPRADPKGRSRRIDQAELTTFWIDFNAARPPFDDARVRRAFASAVDRGALVSGPLGRRAQPAGDLLPAGLPGGPVEATAQQGLDAAGGRTLLQAAGVDPGRLGPVNLLVGPDPGDRALARAVADQLTANLGVAVGLDAVDAETAGRRRYSGDWQLTGPVGWSADYPDLQDWFDLFQGSDPRNLSRWRDGRYDLLVAQGDVETDAGRRLELYRQAHLRLLDEAPAIFLYQRRRWSLVRPSLREVVSSPLDEWPGSLNAARIRPG